LPPTSSSTICQFRYIASRVPCQALLLCPRLCMGIQRDAWFPAQSADALPATLYGHFTQAIYRNRLVADPRCLSSVAPYDVLMLSHHPPGAPTGTPVHYEQTVGKRVAMPGRRMQRVYSCVRVHRYAMSEQSKNIRVRPWHGEGSERESRAQREELGRLARNSMAAKVVPIRLRLPRHRMPFNSGHEWTTCFAYSLW
jgi:hypothetical protein